MDKMDNGHYGHFKNAFLVQLTSAKKESRVLLLRRNYSLNAGACKAGDICHILCAAYASG